MEIDAIALPIDTVFVIARAKNDVSSQSAAGAGEIGVAAALAGRYRRVANYSYKM